MADGRETRRKGRANTTLNRGGLALLMMAGTGAGLMVAMAGAAFWGPVLGELLPFAALLLAAGLWPEFRRAGAREGADGRVLGLALPWRSLGLYSTLAALALAIVAWRFANASLIVAAAACAGLSLYCQGDAPGAPKGAAKALRNLLAITGVVEGMGLLAMAIALAQNVPGWPAFLLFNLIILRVVVWLAWRTPSAGGARFDAAFVLIGSLAPMALVVSALIWPTEARALVFAAGFLAAAAGWLLKWRIVGDPSADPAERAASPHGGGVRRLKATSGLP